MVINIGRAIKIVRQAKGVKASDVAKEAAISTSLLSQIESGDREPSLAVIRRIAQALDVPSEALMVLAQPSEGKLITSDSRARQLALSIRKLADAEERLRHSIEAHGGPDEAKRSSA